MPRRASLPLLLVLLLLGGCVSPAGTEPDAPTPGEPDAPPTLVAPRFGEVVTLGMSTNGAEPNALVAPDGSILVQNMLQLWRSADAGASFEALGETFCDTPRFEPTPVCPPGYESRSPGLVGPGDGDLAALPSGRLLYVGLGGATGAVPFQHSDDGGATWSAPVDLALSPRADRQWIDARGDGAVFVSWRHDFETENGSLMVRASLDGGATWREPVAAAPDAWAGPVTHDPSSGALLLPYYEDGLRVARSADDGASWTSAVVTDDPPRAPVRNGGPLATFPVAAVDEAGTAYLVWAQDARSIETANAKLADVPRVFLAVSRDGGASWGEPRAVSPEGKAAVFPWIVAGKPGRVALAWYENANGAPNEWGADLWNVRVETSVTADAESPEFAGAFVSPEPVHVGGICSDGGSCSFTGRDRSLLDFFEVALDADGRPVVAFAGDGGSHSRLRTTVLFASAVEGTPLR